MATALPPKLEAVLVRIGRAKALNVTKAVKLPYLVDVVANQVLDRPITEGHHEAWDHGVVTVEAWRALDRSEESDSLGLSRSPYSEEKRLTVSDSCDDSALSEQEADVVDAVLDLFADLSASELGEMTKMMNPSIVRWGSNREAGISGDQYERMSPEYQEMAAAVAALKPTDFSEDNFTTFDSIEDAIA